MGLRLGLFGGSFDPFHLGHRLVAEVAMAEAGLNRLIVLPARVSPHKQEKPPADPEDRWLMCVLGTLDDPRLEVARWDLDRAGPSYTYDTVSGARAHFGPDTDLYWLIGADNVETLMRWHRAEELLDLCRFLVVPRGALHGRALAHAIAEAIPERWRDRLQALSMEPIGISSTEVRSRAQEGERLEDVLPRLTALYLERYNCYRPARPLGPDGDASGPSSLPDGR